MMRRVVGTAPRAVGALCAARWNAETNAGKAENALVTSVTENINQSTSSMAADKRDYQLYTINEYEQKLESETFGHQKIIDDAKRVTDNPMWLMWSLAFMSFGVIYVLVCVRLRREKQRFDPKLRAIHSIDMPGGPTIGGPFELEGVDGKKWTNEDFKGKWIYIYFGFTNCPDICPQEMAKMSRLIGHMDKKVGAENWQPVFVSIDAARDTKEAVKEYLKDFHPRILGLTGTAEQVEKAAREFRVYFAVPDEFGDSPDYLIDHSIIMYLMDPTGAFCDYTTKEFTWHESYTKLLRRMVDYEKERARGGAADANLRVANVDSISENTDVGA